jgi:hypothetical protein
MALLVLLALTLDLRTQEQKTSLLIWSLRCLQGKPLAQDKDVQWVIYKNGVELPGSRTIRTISSGSWGSISVSGYTSLSTNDYIEVFSLADAACTVQYASGFLSIMGVPE